MLRLLVAALLLVASGAAAYPEAEAAALWREQRGSDWVVATWHEPEEVAAGTQFNGSLRLAPGHPFEEVHYQVCIVADRCIISPRPATRVDDDTWAFTTADFRLPAAMGGQHHEWRSGQWIGIQWFLRNASGELLEFPRPWQDDERCQEDPVGCSESHYFTFSIATERPAPAPVAAVAGCMLAVAAAAARRRDG